MNCSINLIFKTLLAILLIPTFCFSADYYKIQDLETLQSDYSEACWINDKNEVLGKYKLGKETSVFLWSLDNGLRVLDLAVNTKSCNDVSLKKLNNKGQILGTLFDSSNKPFVFFWDPCKGIQEITVACTQSIVACDMNDKGEVVGIFHRDGKSSAFLWKDGKSAELENLYGDLGIPSTVTDALCINNNSDVGGYARKAIIHKGKIQGYHNAAIVWVAGNCWKITEVFPESYENRKVVGINDSGNILCSKEQSGGTIVNISNGLCLDVLCSPYSHSLNNNNYWIYTKTTASKLRNVGTGYQNDYLPFNAERITNLNNNYWKQVSNLSSVNQKGIVVGSAQNYFGETQAIMLIPQ